jgi:hypothetical protein
MFILLLGICTLFGQDIVGTWSGAIAVQMSELRINFNISAEDEGYSSTMDSPDQKAFGIAVDSTFYTKPELTIKVLEIGLVYVGSLKEDDTIQGKLTQSGQTFDLELVRKVE